MKRIIKFTYISLWLSLMLGAGPVFSQGHSYTEHTFIPMKYMLDSAMILPYNITGASDKWMSDENIRDYSKRQYLKSNECVRMYTDLISEEALIAVKSRTDKDYKIEFLDKQGELVYYDEFSVRDDLAIYDVDLGSLPKGDYFVRLTCGANAMIAELALN